MPKLMQKIKKEIPLIVSKFDSDEGRVWLYATSSGSVDSQNDFIDVPTFFDIRDSFMRKYSTGEAVIDLDHDFERHGHLIDVVVHVFTKDKVQLLIGVKAETPEMAAAIKNGVTGGSIAGYFDREPLPEMGDGVHKLTEPDMLAISVVSNKYNPANPDARWIKSATQAEERKMNLREKIALAIAKAALGADVENADEALQKAVESVMEQKNLLDQVEKHDTGLTEQDVLDLIKKHGQEETDDSGDNKGTSDVDALKADIEKLTQLVKEQQEKIESLQTKAAPSQRQKSDPRITSDVYDRTKFPQLLKTLVERNNGNMVTKADLTSGSLLSGGIGLEVEEANTFIDFVRDQSPVIKAVRDVRMTASKMKWPYLFLASPIWHKGTEGTALDAADEVKAALDEREITTKLLKATVSFTDELLENNIEGPGLIDHFMRMVATEGWNEFERAFLIGNSSAADDSDHPIDNRWDGIYTLLKASRESGNFWNDNGLSAGLVDLMTEADRYWPGTKGYKAIQALHQIPSKFRGVRQNMRWITPSDIVLNLELENANLLSDYRTVLAGINTLEAPMLPTDLTFEHGDPASTETDGTFVIGGDMQNFIMAFQRYVRIEPERSARQGKSWMVLTMRGTPDVEVPAAAVVVDHAKVNTPANIVSA